MRLFRRQAVVKSAQLPKEGSVNHNQLDSGQRRSSRWHENYKINLSSLRSQSIFFTGVLD